MLQVKSPNQRAVMFKESVASPRTIEVLNDSLIR